GGPELAPDLVARILKTPPSKGYKSGGWAFDSEDQVNSDDPADHLRYITDFAENKRSALLSLCEMGARFRIRIFWEFDDEVLSTTLDTAPIGRLAGIIEAIDLSIV